MAGKDEGAETGVHIEKPGEVEGGIKVTTEEGEIAPPLEVPKGEEIPPEGEEVPAAKRIIGKRPLHPALIKPQLRLEGNAIAQLTGYPGWAYTEEELDAIAELIVECGWEMDPRVQVLLSLGSLHFGKFFAMKAWERMGRPGDLKKSLGEVKKKEIPGEEVKA